MFMTILFAVSFILTIIYAGIYGGKPERVGAAAITLSAVSSVPSSTFFASPEFGVLIADCGLIVILIILAVKTDRFWPIWASGFQMVSVVTHIAVAAQSDILPQAYAMFATFWAYPVLASLVWGTLQHRIIAANKHASDI